MRTKKLDVIVCPTCGQEYLPCEIYLPDSFLGKAASIMRDENKTISAFDGNTMDLKEEYCCDTCNTTFNVEAKVTFKSYVPDNSFDEEYSTKINDQILFEEG